MSLGYAGSWPSSRLTCGRLAAAPEKGTTDRLERKMRRAEKVARKHYTNTYGKDAEFEFEAHRPFWNDEWEIGPFDNISLALATSCTSELLNHRTQLFSSLDAFRRTLVCQWNSPLFVQHRGHILVSHDVDSVIPSDSPASWRYCISFRVSFSSSLDMADFQLMRGLASAWNLESFIVPYEASSIVGFRLAIPEASKNVYAANRLTSGCPEDLPYPVTYRLRDLPDAETSIQRLLAAFTVVNEHRGAPASLRFCFHAIPSAMLRYAMACQEIQPVWDNWTFSGNYRSSFDPFARPENLAPGEVRVYPVIQYSNAVWDNAFSADKLFLRASVIHTRDESFIELQTSEGRPWLEKAAEYAGCQVDVWEGPIEKRWGLYT